MPNQQNQSTPSNSNYGDLLNESKLLSQRFAAVGKHYCLSDVEKLFQDIKKEIIDNEVEDRGARRESQVGMIKQLYDHYYPKVSSFLSELRSESITELEKEKILNELESIQFFFLGVLIHRKERLISEHTEGVMKVVKLNFFGSKKSSNENKNSKAHCDLESSIDKVLGISNLGGAIQRKTLDPYTVSHSLSVFKKTMTEVKDDGRSYFNQFDHIKHYDSNFLKNLETIIKQADIRLKQTHFTYCFHAIYFNRSLISRVNTTYEQVRAFINKLFQEMKTNNISYEQLRLYIQKELKINYINPGLDTEKLTEDCCAKLDQACAKDKDLFTWFGQLFSYIQDDELDVEDLSSIESSLHELNLVRTCNIFIAVFVFVHDSLEPSVETRHLKDAIMGALKANRERFPTADLENFVSLLVEWHQCFKFNGVDLTFWRNDENFCFRNLLAFQTQLISNASKEPHCSAVAASSSM